MGEGSAEQHSRVLLHEWSQSVRFGFSPIVLSFPTSESPHMTKIKTYDEKLWDWLIKHFPERTDARRVFDYVTRLNRKPIKIEFYKGGKSIKPKF